MLSAVMFNYCADEYRAQLVPIPDLIPMLTFPPRCRRGAYAGCVSGCTGYRKRGIDPALDGVNR